MEGGDPDAHTQKRPRLDSVNPVYNGLPHPPHPPQTQSNRNSSHPTSVTSVQASSPPPARHYPPPHNLPPPSQPYPPQPHHPGHQGHHSHQPHLAHPAHSAHQAPPPHPPPGSQGPPPPPPGPQAQPHYPPGPPQPSPSIPASDIRAYSDPRNIPSPSQRTHGVNGSVTTLAARSTTIPQDNISTYRPPPHTPQATSAPEPHSSRSTSVSLDSKPPPPPPPQGMEHGAPPGPWSMNPEQHRHHSNGSMSNGYSHQAISPPNEQPFHPPPMGQGQAPYGQPVGAYTPGPYMNQAAFGQAAQIRRKQVRATQACNNCRSRKQKCDEARPCQFCRENNFDCQYKDVPPPKQDRSMMQLQDSVNSISDTLKSFVEGFNTWKHSVESRLPPSKGGEVMQIASNHASPEQSFGVRGSMSEQSGSRMPTPVQGRAQIRRVNSMKTESPVVPHSNISPIPPHASTPIKQESILVPQQPATPAESVRTDHTQPVGDPSKDKSGLQSDHTTPAHQLLEEWPSMKTFYENLPAWRNLAERGHKITDYPMVFEQDRGLIRVWGIGEGQDANDGAQGPSSPESNDSDASSPAPVREGIWGYPPADHSSPSTLGGDATPHLRETVGGLGLDGKPNFQSATLWRLHSSYMQHIHSLHPFLNPSKLRKMISEFSAVYSPDFKGKTAASPGSAVPGYLNAGVKRKRSSSAFGDHYTPVQDPSVNGIERSLRNAIVLLVLALGKVCEYEEPLPAPQSERGLTSDGSWGFTRGSPHSANNSFSEEMETPQRNIDIIPGMAYYSYATDILGNQQGGNTVAHAQAMLLAALYLGQFARALESWSWINNACRISLVLIKADMDKIERKIYFDAAHPVPQFTEKENYRLNLVKCVYWTCLQLETDILAEMSTLPPTEISKYQDRISYPSGVFEKFPTNPDAMTYNENSEHDKTMWIYSSHIHLRVILNEAHNTLYGATGRKRSPNFDTTNVKEVASTARFHADILLSWRRLLPQELSWDDGDPPSTDIHIARLRAKYYGGHYMILRPFLHIAVHDIPLPPGPPTAWSQTSSPAAMVESAGTPTHNSMSRNLIDLTPGQDEVLNVAHQCITSAIRSTIAFDRVGAHPNGVYTRFENKRPRRLILTNIFGTMHAQFGNMIVLAAVWKSRLRQFLPEDTMLTKSNLIDLFDRTTKVLGEVAPNSPILKMDLDILHNVRKQLNLK